MVMKNLNDLEIADILSSIKTIAIIGVSKNWQ